MKRRARIRGNLAFVLLLFVMILSLLVLLVHSSLMSTYATRHSEESEQARLVAESTLATVIARIKQDNSYGTSALAITEPLPLPGDAAAYGSLTFGPGASHNNWRSDVPIVENDAVVCPANGIILHCTGHYRGQQRTVSTLLHIPPFAAAIASVGPIQSSGMVLGSVPPGYDWSKGLDASQLQPALMESKSDLSVTGPSVLVGEGKAGGAAVVPTSASFKVYQNTTVDDIPNIDLSRLIFTDASGVQTLGQDNFAGPAVLGGKVQWTERAGRPLTFQSGLSLQGATVQVKGDVVIEGGLVGQGALIVNGNVVVRGQSAFAADNLCAIVASGSVSLTGNGQDQSVYRGLVYGNGVTVKDVTIVGTLVNAGGAVTNVDGAKVAYVPNSGIFQWDLSFSLGPSIGAVSSVALRQGFGVKQFLSPDGKSLVVPSNVPQAASPANPLGLSDFQLMLLPYLQFTVNGKPSSWEASSGLTAGQWAANDSNVVFLLHDASTAVNGQLAGQALALIKQQYTFKLNLNQFLNSSGSLHMRWCRK